MSVYYFKRKNEWYSINVPKDDRNFTNVDVVIKQTENGNGRFIQGYREDVPEFLLRKYMPKDILAKEEMILLVLSCDIKEINFSVFTQLKGPRRFPIY